MTVALLSQGPMEDGIEAVADHAVNVVGAAGAGDSAEEQLAAAVSVGVTLRRIGDALLQ